MTRRDAIAALALAVMCAISIHDRYTTTTAMDRLEQRIAALEDQAIGARLAGITAGLAQLRRDTEAFRRASLRRPMAAEDVGPLLRLEQQLHQLETSVAGLRQSVKAAP